MEIFDEVPDHFLISLIALLSVQKYQSIPIPGLPFLTGCGAGKLFLMPSAIYEENPYNLRTLASFVSIC